MRNRAENQITLALIRHGATKANEEHRYLGKTDEALSEWGRRELLSYKAQGRYPKADAVFVSPMKRCVETAGLLYPSISPVYVPEWREMDFGEFENKNFEELNGDARYQAWIDSGGALAFPGGESREDFVSRCKKGLVKLCESTPAQAAAVVHGGTIMALLYAFGGMEYYKGQVSNGGGYLCTLTWLGAMDAQTGNSRMADSIQIRAEAKL